MIAGNSNNIIYHETNNKISFGYGFRLCNDSETCILLCFKIFLNKNKKKKFEKIFNCFFNIELRKFILLFWNSIIMFSRMLGMVELYSTFIKFISYWFKFFLWNSLLSWWNSSNGTSRTVKIYIYIFYIIEKDWRNGSSYFFYYLKNIIY